MERACSCWAFSVGYPVSQGYPMRDGSQCTALLAGIPMEEISESLSLNVNDTLVFPTSLRAAAALW